MLHPQATTLASSRAFDVDEEHGEGLVPLIDMLNHKAALVPHPCKEDGKEEGEEEGGAGGREKGEEFGDEESEKSGEGQVEFQRDCCLRISPTVCSGGESESEDEEEQGEQWGAGERGGEEDTEGGDDEGDDSDDDGDGDEDEDDGDGEGNEEDVAVVTTLAAMAAGQEICHTYGELGNWELLAGYGFTLPHNPFDTSALEWHHVGRAAEIILGGRPARQRL